MDEYRIIIITKRAEIDMQNIWIYIADELLEPDTADGILDCIDKGILTLKTLPKRHKLVNDARLARRGIRPLQIENYTVFYTISEQEQEERQVYIVRVLYAHRDWQNLL